MTERKQKSTPADRTVHLHFPNEEACVRILEILQPFTEVQRELILNVVAANRTYPECRTRGAGFAGIRKVVMPEPLLSVVEHRAAKGWNAK